MFDESGAGGRRGTPFEVVEEIQSAGVGVTGLDLRRTLVVFRTNDDEDVDET